MLLTKVCMGRDSQGGAVGRGCLFTEQAQAPGPGGHETLICQTAEDKQEVSTLAQGTTPKRVLELYTLDLG